MQASDSIRRRGGLAATFELYEDGFDRRTIALAVRRGTVRRIRQGRYAAPHTAQVLQRAARVGGRLTCSSALDVRDVWVVADPRLHVSVAPGATQLRLPRDQTRRLGAMAAEVEVHWTATGEGPSRLIVPDLVALGDYTRCASPELVGASADSIIHSRPQLKSALRDLASRQTRLVREVLTTVDGVSESGTEFLFRWRMRTLGVEVRPQVHIPTVGRVDFVVGTRLVVEVDSVEYHTDPIQFEADRCRDAALSILGFRVLRFTYMQVMHDWSSVNGAVRAAISRGDHW
ncbi:hypothetical protein BH09ACT4_BH09ACT4_24600 [soil metagenome]